jgi:1,4-alpha-glucan branching enzyme
VIRLSATAKTVKVTFALPLDQTASGCSVVGNFNEWQPGTHQMRLRTNATRSASVTVPRGTSIRFRYLAENGHWFNDPDVAQLDGSDSVLVV